MTIARTLALLLLTTLLVPAARADEERELHVDAQLEFPLVLAMGLAWVSSEIDKPQLAPNGCRWCDRNADGSDALNGMDRAVRDALKWSESNRDTADVVSSVVGFGVTPVLALVGPLIAGLHDGTSTVQRQQEDALLIIEAAMLASCINQITKFAVGRERPFVHVLTPSEKVTTPNPSDNNLSFFSGHTTVTFALAAAAGTVSMLRRDRWSPLVWALGLAGAATTAYLRLAAQKHYLSDVLVGVAVGGGLGVAMPVAHLQKKVSITVVPRDDGAMLSVGGRF